MTPTSRQHLTDERLIDTYFARVGDPSGRDAVEAESDHVRRCEVCSRRLEDLTASLERLRRGAVAEADAYFTPDRLAAQQERILRHLEGVDHPARVIPFPHPPASVRTTALRHPLYRWVAAAAAAGLLIGVGAGRLLYVQPDRDSRAADVPQAAASVQARAAAPVLHAPAGVRETLVGNLIKDEAFLSEIEDAVLQQRISELRALDALTPHIRDTSVRLK